MCTFDIHYYKTFFCVHNTTHEGFIPVKTNVWGWWEAISRKSKCKIPVLVLYFPDDPYYLPVVFVWLYNTLDTEQCVWLTVASFTKQVNPRWAQRPLKTNGCLANLGLTILVKEATGGQVRLPLSRILRSLIWQSWVRKSECPSSVTDVAIPTPTGIQAERYGTHRPWARPKFCLIFGGKGGPYFSVSWVPMGPGNRGGGGGGGGQSKNAAISYILHPFLSNLLDIYFQGLVPGKLRWHSPDSR